MITIMEEKGGQIMEADKTGKIRDRASELVKRRIATKAT